MKKPDTTTHLLVRKAEERFAGPQSGEVLLAETNAAANTLLNDLQKFPHAYALGCLMHRQIGAERAWLIMHRIKVEFNTFNIHELQLLGAEKLREFFEKEKLHRYNARMAKVFYLGVEHILDKYDGNAANIWLGTPSSATVVGRFLEFKEAGMKIATMAANILATRFQIPFSDHYSIDISVDVHIRRVMNRIFFCREKVKDDIIIYKARELNPEFPGIIDALCWNIGRDFCRPKEPLCSQCEMQSVCRMGKQRR